MKILYEIKLMMAAGETVQAEEALKELMAAEPNNLKAKMLYGTCRQLLGDEETFKRIHDELALSFERQEDDPPTAETVLCPQELSLWKKYHALWMALIVGGLVLAGTTAVVWFYGNQTANQMSIAAPAAVSQVDRAPELQKCLPVDRVRAVDAPDESSNWCCPFDVIS